LTGATLIWADLSGANLNRAQNLTQDQLASVKPTHPPTNLPDGLTWPFVKEDGTWVKK